MSCYRQLRLTCRRSSHRFPFLDASNAMLTPASNLPWSSDPAFHASPTDQHLPAAHRASRGHRIGHFTPPLPTSGLASDTSIQFSPQNLAQRKLRQYRTFQGQLSIFTGGESMDGAGRILDLEVGFVCCRSWNFCVRV